MKCSKCGAELENFPVHLAGLASVVCKNCVGALPPAVNAKDLFEKMSNTYVPRSRHVEGKEEDGQVAA